MNAIDKFSDKKILVVGDLMIDHYMYGETKRISPEAPVPVVNIFEEKNILGGACNTANNISSLGAKAYVAGIVGDDEYSEIMKNLLKEKKIKSIIVKDKSRPTIVKKRVISRGFFQMIRIDNEKTTPLSDELGKKLFGEIKKIIKNIDAVIISHAHLDHVGLLPYLYKMGYKGPCYMTTPTRDIASLLCLDFIGVAYKKADQPIYKQAPPLPLQICLPSFLL